MCSASPPSSCSRGSSGRRLELNILQHSHAPDGPAPTRAHRGRGGPGSGRRNARAFATLRPDGVPVCHGPPPRVRGDILLATTPPDADNPHAGPRPPGRCGRTGRDRKGGPHDGPPRGARRRAQGEEASRGRRRAPERGARPPLGRAEGILAPQPPERGGRKEGPTGAGAAYMSARRPAGRSGAKSHEARASEEGYA